MHEKMFESRLFFVDKLIGMGARIVLCDPHRAVIAGPSHASAAATVESPDIRAGMAMLLAALARGGTEHDPQRGPDRARLRADRRASPAHSAPTSSGWMTEPPGVCSEVSVGGPVPRWAIPGWLERFGVVAGVTGRGTGAPEPGFDLGLWTAQPVGEVSTRWRALLRSEPGFSGAVLSHQVHGVTVAWHPAPTRGWTIMGGADGHSTAAPGLLLLVTVADCVPVYLLEPRRRICALIHAGWRGVAGGILSVAIRQLEAVAAISPGDLIMHCGVAISGPCYEVDHEVATACGKPALEGVKVNLDLRDRLAEQADVLGVGVVTVSDHCTASRPDIFYSHRRSGGLDGRQVAYLGIPDPGSSAVPL